MNKLALWLTLPIVAFTACAPTVRAGEVSYKSHQDAYQDTRTREVYKFDCGRYRASIATFKYKYGCGTGYFEESYEVTVRECHKVTLVDPEGNGTDWCVDPGWWERLQVGAQYSVQAVDFKPGTLE